MFAVVLVLLRWTDKLNNCIKKRETKPFDTYTLHLTDYSKCINGRTFRSDCRIFLFHSSISFGSRFGVPLLFPSRLNNHYYYFYFVGFYSFIIACSARSIPEKKYDSNRVETQKIPQTIEPAHTWKVLARIKRNNNDSINSLHRKTW